MGVVRWLVRMFFGAREATPLAIGEEAAGAIGREAEQEEVLEAQEFVIEEKMRKLEQDLLKQEQQLGTLLQQRRLVEAAALLQKVRQELLTMQRFEAELEQVIINNDAAINHSHAIIASELKAVQQEESKIMGLEEDQRGEPLKLIESLRSGYQELKMLYELEAKGGIEKQKQLLGRARAAVQSAMKVYDQILAAVRAQKTAEAITQDRLFLVYTAQLAEADKEFEQRAKEVLAFNEKVANFAQKLRSLWASLDAQMAQAQQVGSEN